jgi:2-polyprenyl-3-methyl-5-hydroxy-6-metoxy-1,4-benzoquinol methylase
MDKEHQNEVLNYFNKYAQHWKIKAMKESEDEVNIINQRNNYVIQIIDERDKTQVVLDVGCGTGDLICAIAKKGITAIGVDFSKDMIMIAKENSRSLNADKASFICCSIFDYNFENNKYDVISANGFIEYISYKELNMFLEKSLMSLRSGGSIILGSRNRLFNILSLNEFTDDEIKQNTVKLLLMEAMQISKIDDINELGGIKTIPFQKKGKEHTQTGIKVATRYQYTPGQLINMLKDKGFEPVEIYPIHVHGVLPNFKKNYPSIHASISNFLQQYARNNMSLIPQSSSFMIHAKKR